MGYLYIFATVFFTVLGQIIIKYGLSSFGKTPSDIKELLIFLIKLLGNFYFLGGLICGFLAAVCWIFALNKFDLSFAYPFTALSFVLITILSALFFKEYISLLRFVGILTICLGVFLVSRS